MNINAWKIADTSDGRDLVCEVSNPVIVISFSLENVSISFRQVSVY